jgi:hypothetical protein
LLKGRNLAGKTKQPDPWYLMRLNLFLTMLGVRSGRMSEAPRIPALIDDRMPVEDLALLATQLKIRILEKVEPGQDWAVFSIHLGARGRWCFRFNGKIRREWYGRTFGEAIEKLMAWLELDEERTLNLTLGLTEDGRFREESGI